MWERSGRVNSSSPLQIIISIKYSCRYSMSLSGINIIHSNDNHGKVATGEVEELKQRLEEERKLRQESDHELEIQVSFF